MIKHYINFKHLTRLAATLTLLLSFGLMSQAQGQSAPVNETFDGVTSATGGNGGSYTQKSFTGQQGGTWTATDARTDQTINGSAILVRNGELISPSFSGGIGSLTITTERAFSGGSGNITVYVNDVEVGTVPYGDNVETSTITDINSGGSSVVKLETPGNGDRIVFDDLQWTGYVADEPFFTTNPLSLSDFTYTVGEGPSGSQSFNLSGENLDGTDVSITAPTNFEISETEASGYGSSVTLGAYDGTETTLYVRMQAGLTEGDYSGAVDIIGGGSSATVDLSGSVFGSFSLPFTNAFRTQDDYDAAVAAGFTITSNDQRTSAGGYLKIDNGQFVQSPSLDLTSNSEDALVASYSITTFGGGSDPEFSFLISEDGGNTFTEVASDLVPGSYETIEHSFDLSTLGLLDDVVAKFEQTDGSKSTRFRDFELSLEAPAVDPVLSVTPETLSGLDYAEGEGPSAPQSFTLSGSNLDGSDVSITAPAGFEVSANETSGYVSSATLTAYDGTEFPLYVRLSDGLTAGTYSGDLTVSGGGATDATVDVNGSVTAPVFLIYEFTGESVEPTQNPSDVMTSDFQISSGNVNFGTFGTWSGSGVPYAEGSSGWGETSVSDAKYFFFDMEADPGKAVNLSGMSFEWRTTGAGPTAITVELNGDELATFDSGSNEQDVFQFDLSGRDFLQDLNFRIYGWDNGSRTSSGGGAFRINDVQVDGEVVEIPFTEISETGGAGFRMLALPVDNLPFSNLAGQNLIQGIPGTNAFYDEILDAQGEPVDFENDVEANVYQFINTATPGATDAWTAPSDISDQIAAGTGFIWFFFNNDRYYSVPLPFNLSAAGDETTGNIVRAQNADVDYTLLGNPYNSALPTANLTGDIQAAVQVWNPIGGDGEGAFEAPVGDIEPFTGFFVEKSGAGGDVTIQDPGSSPRPAAEDELSRIALNLQGVSEDGQTVADNATQMRFMEGAGHGWDTYDLTKLRSLNHSFAAVSFVGEKNDQPNLQLIDSRAHNPEEMIEVPVAFTAEQFSGEFELSASLENIPADWDIYLIDTETGESIDVRDGQLSFSHTSESDVKGNETLLPQGAGRALTESYVKNDEAIEARFILQVNPQPLSAPVGGELPQELALGQNYPNPFNPATQISYDLPESADVRLDVYNVQGQRVATLVNASQTAGSYNVSFDAGNLASGVYLYRLQTGNSVLTRKMTLVK